MTTVCKRRLSSGGNDQWRREWDSNPRYGFHRTHAFQACDLNHSSISPRGPKYNREAGRERGARVGRLLSGQAASAAR